MMDERNYTLLSRKMDIPENVITKIKSIEIDTTKSSVLKQYKITFNVFDPAVFDICKNGFINYINNDNLIAFKYDITQSNIKVLISKIKNEINILDSIQKQIIVRSVNNSPPLIIMYEKNSFSTEYINLLLKKQKEEEHLQLLKPLSIVNDVIQINKPVSKLKTYLILYVFLFLIIGLFTSVVLENRKNK
jgi:hypothetical protein